MARPASKHPTDGELEVLKVLWESGPTGLGDICSAIRQHRSVATTTIATILKIMREKGLVKRTEGPRGYLWSAKVRKEATARRILNKHIQHLFDGSAQLLVSHLIGDGKLSASECDEIRRMLEEHGKGHKPESE